MSSHNQALRTINLTSMCYHSLLMLVVVIGCESSDTDLADNNIYLPLDTLKVVLEIGAEIGDSTNTFASIVAANIDEQGRIFALDEVDACLKVYDMQGNYIQQISRRGSGPGELSHPKGMFIMPDSRLGVIAPSKQGFVVFDDSLNFLEEISLWQQNSPYHVTPISDNRIVVCRYFESQRDETAVMHRTISIFIWGDDEPAFLLWQDSLEISESDLSQDPSVMFRYSLFERLSTGGNEECGVFFAPQDPYVYCITGWDSTGTEILSINRDLTPVPKESEEIIAEIFYVTNHSQRTSGRDLPFEFNPAPYRNMIIDVGIGPERTLWVRCGTHIEPFFDIYDLNGNLLRHAVFLDDGMSWQVEVTPHGILAWELDPIEGYQKLYLLK